MNDEEKRFMRWGKIMMLAIAFGAFLLLASIFVFCFCSHEEDKNKLLEFKTVTGLSPAVIEVIKAVYGSIEKSGQDLDIDGDRINDYYVVTRTGIVFAAKSKESVQEKGVAKEHVWREIPMSWLKTAKTGEYPAR